MRPVASSDLREPTLRLAAHRISLSRLRRHGKVARNAPCRCELVELGHLRHTSPDGTRATRVEGTTGRQARGRGYFSLDLRQPDASTWIRYGGGVPEDPAVRMRWRVQ